MNLTEVKKIEVGGKAYSIKLTARAMIEYEKLSGRSVAEYEGTENLLQFFYVTTKAGAKHEKEVFKYTSEEFLDLIDDYYVEAVSKFSQAIYTPGGEGKKPKGSSI